MACRQVVGELKDTGGPINFEWEIANFRSLSAKVGEWYYSPVYFFGDSSWYIKLYPNGQTYNSSEGYIGVYLGRGDSGPPVTVTYSLFVKKMSGREVIVNEDKKTFDGKDDAWGCSECVRRSKVIEAKSEFLPSGVFTIICSLKRDETRVIKDYEVLRRAMKDCITKYGKSTQTEADVGTEKLLTDLKGLVVSGDESDVIIKVQDEEFQLHRAILAARTPVFNSMFKHDMKEKATGVVSVDDFEAGTFRIFVHYLYTGGTDQLTPENMISLYKMADKYQVQELQSSCLDIMKRTLSVDTFCDVVDLAMKYGEEDLKEEATDFLSEHTIDIIGTKEWRTLLRNNMIEVNELLKEALIQKLGD